MRYSILHLGVPIGMVNLTPTEIAVGELIPSAGYDAIRQTIRMASEALWAAGFFGGPSGGEFDPAALGRAAALSLELRDERGVFVPADFVNVVERPREGDAPVVFARFRLAPAGIPALNR